MNNYLVLQGGSPIELTDKQVEEIRKSLSVQRRLADVKEGDTFKLDGTEFVVLEHSKETTAVITKDLIYENIAFGRSNNFADDNCNVMKKLFEFQKVLESNVGVNNLIVHKVDLISEDGLKDYGVIRCKVSLLTCDLYRRYVHILDKHKVKKWWWLATPHSTATHDCASYVKCVGPSGNVDNDGYDGGNGGVRPFCILNSNIFVSE